MDPSHGTLIFDRYRSLSWNLDLWFTRTCALDCEADSTDYSGTLLRGLTAAYLDLLGDTYAHFAAAHEWASPQSGGPTSIGDFVVYAIRVPSIEQIEAIASRHGPARVLVVTQEGLRSLLTGESLKDALLEGVLWRPCLTKLVQAYNYLVDSEFLGGRDCLKIEKRE